jgi:hypothetical protein
MIVSMTLVRYDTTTGTSNQQVSNNHRQALKKRNHPSNGHHEHFLEQEYVKMTQ